MLEPLGEVTIDAGGVRLAGLRFGAQDAPPVLALHGWLDNAASFEGLARHLDGVHLVALDLAGHGRSQRRADGVYIFLDYIADVAAAIAALGWSRCALLGHSLGAGVAALVAGTCPELVSHLILLEGLGPLSNPDARAPTLLAEALRAEAAARAREDRSAGYASAEVVARRLVEATGLSPHAAATLLARGLETREDGRVHWRADPRLRLPSRVRLTEAQVLAFLRGIACPTLVVRARPGMPVDEDLAASRLAAIAGVRVVEVAGGHHVHLDDPEPVADLLRPFLTV